MSGRLKKELISAGEIVNDLQKLADQYSDCNVTCILPDDTYCYITGVSRDDDGDLCFFAEEDDFSEGVYDVDMLLAELESVDASTKVYIDAYGYYYGVTMNGDSLFTYDEGNDDVYCIVDLVGESPESLL